MTGFPDQTILAGIIQIKLPGPKHVTIFYESHRSTTYECGQRPIKLKKADNHGQRKTLTGGHPEVSSRRARQDSKSERTPATRIE